MYEGASLRMKGIVCKACVHSVLMYGAKTWAMKAAASHVEENA